MQDHDCPSTFIVLWNQRSRRNLDAVTPSGAPDAGEVGRKVLKYLNVIRGWPSWEILNTLRAELLSNLWPGSEYLFSVSASYRGDPDLRHAWPCFCFTWASVRQPRPCDVGILTVPDSLAGDEFCKCMWGEARMGWSAKGVHVENAQISLHLGERTPLPRLPSRLGRQNSFPIPNPVGDFNTWGVGYGGGISPLQTTREPEECLIRSPTCRKLWVF